MDDQGGGHQCITIGVIGPATGKSDSIAGIPKGDHLSAPVFHDPGQPQDTAGNFINAFCGVPFEVQVLPGLDCDRAIARNAGLGWFCLGG